MVGANQGAEDRCEPDRSADVIDHVGAALVAAHGRPQGSPLRVVNQG